MNVLEQFVLAWQALFHTLRQLFRAPLWAPWMLLAAVQLAVVASLWWFAHPILSWFMAPLVSAVAGSNALRYPNLFRLLPVLFARADVLVGALVAPLVIGASTILFATRFSGGKMRLGEALGQTSRRAIALIMVNLPLNLLVIGLSYGLEWLVGMRGSSVIARKMVQLVTVCGVLLLQAFFLWINALVVLGGRSVLGTLAVLPRSAAHGMWAALTLSLLWMIPLLPIQLLLRRSSSLVDRGAPETVGWLVVAEVLLALVTSFVLTGSTTLVYQSTVGPALREEES